MEHSLNSFGKYRLLAALGHGGMADVYLALVAGPGRFNKLIVLKVLRDEIAHGSEDGVVTFMDEARLAAQLVHANIVQTYEVGEIDGRYFLAMEHLHGQPYRALLNRTRNARLPLHEELRILSEVARGLHYAHELRGLDGQPLRVVHRDIGPQNVIITYDGHVKLVDFGIATSQQDEHRTQHGLVKGKLDYIAPEQLRGETVDRRADIFALGVMLWEAVTGQRFAGGRNVSDPDKIRARAAGAEPKVRDVKPDVPEELAAIVDRATALDPNARFADAAEFADALDAFVEAGGVRATAKSLSQHMLALFATEQAALQKLIEREIKQAKQDGARAGEPVRPLPQLDAGDSLGTGAFWPQPSLRLAAADGSERSWSRSRTRAAWLIWGLPLLGLGAALAGWLLYGAGRELAASASPPLAPAPAPPAVPAAAPVPAPPPPPPSAAPDPESVRVSLEVEPADATARLDRTPIPLPFTGTFRKDALLHPLRVRAPGHRPYNEFIRFDRDQHLKITLEPWSARKAKPEGAPAAAPPAPETAAASGDEPDPDIVSVTPPRTVAEEGDSKAEE